MIIYVSIARFVRFCKGCKKSQPTKPLQAVPVGMVCGVRLLILPFCGAAGSWAAAPGWAWCIFPWREGCCPPVPRPRSRSTPASAGCCGRPGRLKIHPNAVIIKKSDGLHEVSAGLNDKIGSTESGTGSAVISRIKRSSEVLLAKDCKELQPYLCDTIDYLRDILNRSQEVIIEGTQGFGLSLLHAKEYPFTTSRDTSAAAFVSEAGLSPFDVKNIIMALRTFPIRVAGNSGPLPKETTWTYVSEVCQYVFRRVYVKLQMYRYYSK